ncbi:insulinase family protein, partial [Pelomonas sp. HMWF004]
MKTSTPTFRLGLMAAALALAGMAQAARVELPKELPPFGKDKPLAVPNITQQTLPNGLQVWVVPRDGVPRVDFVLAVRGAGFGADAADAPGRTKLLASLLTGGTAQRSSKQIAEAAQALGGSVGASASNDGISVTANALASHAGDMSRLLAEVARKPVFPDAEVQLARTNALQSLKASSTQPAFRAAKALDGAIYGDHA